MVSLAQASAQVEPGLIVGSADIVGWDDIEGALLTDG